MNIFNKVSIKTKTYLLVLLSVVVALILSSVSNDGLNTIKEELDGLVFETKIERYTSKLIIEEQNYRLNTNGSIYDFNEANKAYENAMRYVDEIYEILSRVKSSSETIKFKEKLQRLRQSTDEYKALYLKGVSLLTELNKQANILEREGEYITSQIQAYVEAKRVEIKQQLNKKTIEKINNGSNIWQYTYVTRLAEKKYRLSPDAKVLAEFKKDYSFMMSEWARLKRMSDQTFEYEKLENFNSSAKKYQQAMLTWSDFNRQLVNDVLPEMKSFGNSIISRAVQSAEGSLQRMADKQKTISLSFILVSAVTIILGLLFAAVIVRSISSGVSSFQEGLLNFFDYLNQRRTSVESIKLQGNDEISHMAEVVNQNIIKIQKVIDRKADYQQALLEWSKVNYQDNDATIYKATELSARALHVERVSIWLFNDSWTELKCADLFLAQDNIHEKGAVLTEHEYPEYFRLIRKGSVLAIDNVREEANIEIFYRKYLFPLDVYSTLDLPIIIDSRLIGVIRHEKIAEEKSWQVDELDFANSVVNAISLSLEIKKRRHAQKELKAQKEMLHHQAHHDALTGLPNRLLFNDRLKQLIKQAQRQSSQLAVLFIDLDHFKGINDSMGHEIGDKLLIEVSSRLKSVIRQTDTLARLGGDEFTVILDQINNADAVVAITQHLLEIMSTPIELSGQSLYVTLSVGVAIFPDDGTNAEALLKNADAAMYQAKDDGRNTYQFYTQAMTEKAFERIAMEASFRNALEREEFVVFYQPQVDARSEKIIGMEALVRWDHPDMGLISPAKFLSFAHETGLIVPLDLWVMKTAMTQLYQWQQEGLDPGVLSLNLSIKQLQSNEFSETLETMLSETHCLPEWIELEVTEGQIMKDTGLAIQILNNIKSLGISLAIDDFGTGYSSLSQLKRLPINKLKIDQSFIRDLPDDEEDTVISKSIIALSTNMGLDVIAEGVETLEQKEFLLQNGCHYIQGFYFGKPMSAEGFSELLRTNRI